LGIAGVPSAVLTLGNPSPLRTKERIRTLKIRKIKLGGLWIQNNKAITGPCEFTVGELMQLLADYNEDTRIFVGVDTVKPNKEETNPVLAAYMTLPLLPTDTEVLKRLDNLVARVGELEETDEPTASNDKK